MITYAQEETTGIPWASGISWERVKQKAKDEGKYILVDCYATWCGPCKAMDREVYPSEKLGEYVNKKFVAVKVQMDSSKNDNSEIRKWYGDAKMLRGKFSVDGYPSFLFFTSEGRLLHRDLGYKDVNGFLLMARNALDSSRQYNVLLQNYLNGARDYSTMIYLAGAVNDMGDKKVAESIAKNYKENYLNTIDDKALLQKDNIDFLAKFSKLINTDDRFFKICLENGRRVDSATKMAAYAKRIVDYVITKEEIWKKLIKSGKPLSAKPNWGAITSTIQSRYKLEYTHQLVLQAKITYYQFTKDWWLFAKYKDESIKINPPKGGGFTGGAWDLNGAAWNVFLYCNDKSVLRKALTWSNLSLTLEDDPNYYVQYYDTKANLLYKIGDVKEAIKWQQKAVQVNQENAKKLGLEQIDEDYQNNLNKMIAGKPTW